jgi:phage replication O-like protein O
MVAMASPQLEGGYTRLANELLEWIARAPLNGSQFRLLMAVIRKTYGHQKKDDRISATQFHEATGLHKQVIARELRDLAKRGYLVSIGDIHHAKSYQIQKNYELWDGGKVYTDWLTDQLPEVDTDRSTPEANCIPISARVYTDPLTEVYTDPLTTKERKKTSKERDTEPHGSGAEPAPVRSGTLRQQFEEDYRAASDQRERVGVAGRYFQKLLGKPPNHKRIAGLLSDAKSGNALFAAMAEAAKQTISDDPHDYVHAIITREIARKGGSHEANGRSSQGGNYRSRGAPDRLAVGAAGSHGAGGTDSWATGPPLRTGRGD